MSSEKGSVLKTLIEKCAKMEVKWFDKSDTELGAHAYCDFQEILQDLISLHNDNIVMPRKDLEKRIRKLKEVGWDNESNPLKIVSLHGQAKGLEDLRDGRWLSEGKPSKEDLVSEGDGK